MFDRFSDRALKVVTFAKEATQHYGQGSIEPVHILLGILEEGSGVAANVLKGFGVDLRAQRLKVERGLAEADSMPERQDRLRPSEVFRLAIEEARSLNHNYVGTEHLLLALLGEPSGVTAQALGHTVEDVRTETLALLGPTPPQEPADPSK